MINYAVVGAGWISQIAFLPGAAQSGNSRVVGIVSGDRPKASQLSEFHGVETVVGYDGYDALLASPSIDAVYIALPNHMHADYSIRAARAGKHILVEKPLAANEAEALAMIAAAREANVLLMTAYRLHNEPGTVAVLDHIRAGAIGRPLVFQSLFSFQTVVGNHRLTASTWGGPLQDIGVYCVNAARHVFAEEPIETMAMAQRPGDDPRFGEVDATVAATLRFPSGGVAQFVVSFGASAVDSYRVVGTTGDLELDPGFKFETATKSSPASRRRVERDAVSPDRPLRRAGRLLLRLHRNGHTAGGRRRRGPCRHARADRDREGVSDRQAAADRLAAATPASDGRHGAARGPDRSTPRFLRKVPWSDPARTFRNRYAETTSRMNERRTSAGAAPATYTTGGRHEEVHHGACVVDRHRDVRGRGQREESVLPAAELDHDPVREPRCALLCRGDEEARPDRASDRPERARRSGSPAATGRGRDRTRRELILFASADANLAANLKAPKRRRFRCPIRPQRDRRQGRGACGLLAVGEARARPPS